MSCRDQKGGASDDVIGNGEDLEPVVREKFVEMGVSAHIDNYKMPVEILNDPRVKPFSDNLKYCKRGELGYMDSKVLRSVLEYGNAGDGDAVKKKRESAIEEFVKLHSSLIPNAGETASRYNAERINKVLRQHRRYFNNKAYFLTLCAKFTKIVERIHIEQVGKDREALTNLPPDVAAMLAEQRAQHKLWTDIKVLTNIFYDLGGGEIDNDLQMLAKTLAERVDPVNGNPISVWTTGQYGLIQQLGYQPRRGTEMLDGIRAFVALFEMMTGENSGDHPDDDDAMGELSRGLHELADKIAKQVQEATIAAEHAAAEEARVEAERIAAEQAAAEATRVEAEKIAAEKAAAEAARVKAERIAAAEAAAEAARVEAEKIAAEQAAAEAARIEAEKIAAEQAVMSRARAKHQVVLDEMRKLADRVDPVLEYAPAAAATMAYFNDASAFAKLALDHEDNYINTLVYAILAYEADKDEQTQVGEADKAEKKKNAMFAELRRAMSSLGYDDFTAIRRVSDARTTYRAAKNAKALREPRDTESAPPAVADEWGLESASVGGKKSRRKKTKRRHKTGGKKSRKLRKRATIKGGKFSGGATPKHITLAIAPDVYWYDRDWDATNGEFGLDFQVTPNIKSYSIKDIFGNRKLKAYRDTIIKSNEVLVDNLKNDFKIENDFNIDFPGLCLIRFSKDPKSVACIEGGRDLINKPLGTLEPISSRPDDAYIICTVKCILRCKGLSGSSMEPILYTNFDRDNVTISHLISNCLAGEDYNVDDVATSIKTFIKKDGKTLLQKKNPIFSPEELTTGNASIAPIDYDESSNIDDILKYEGFYTMEDYNGTPIKHINIDLVFTESQLPRRPPPPRARFLNLRKWWRDARARREAARRADELEGRGWTYLHDELIARELPARGTTRELAVRLALAPVADALEGRGWTYLHNKLSARELPDRGTTRELAERLAAEQTGLAERGPAVVENGGGGKKSRKRTTKRTTIKGGKRKRRRTRRRR